MKASMIDEYYPVVGYINPDDLAFNVEAVLDFYRKVRLRLLSNHQKLVEKALRFLSID